MSLLDTKTIEETRKLSVAPRQIDRNPEISASSRLVSIDALRGFDMVWIIGGDYLLPSLPEIHHSRLTREMPAPLEHCAGARVQFSDLPFPPLGVVVGRSPR